MSMVSIDQPIPTQSDSTHQVVPSRLVRDLLSHRSGALRRAVAATLAAPLRLHRLVTDTGDYRNWILVPALS